MVNHNPSAQTPHKKGTGVDPASAEFFDDVKKAVKSIAVFHPIGSPLALYLLYRFTKDLSETWPIPALLRLCVNETARPAINLETIDACFVWIVSSIIGTVGAHFSFTERRFRWGIAGLTTIAAIGISILSWYIIRATSPVSVPFFDFIARYFKRRPFTYLYVGGAAWLVAYLQSNFLGKNRFIGPCFWLWMAYLILLFVRLLERVTY